jgi:PAS domain S-box-containing protein
MTHMSRFRSGPQPPADDAPAKDASSARKNHPGGAFHTDLDRAAQHYAAIIESSDDAILSKDLNGVILTWNAGAERLFGYTAEEAVGKPVTIIFPADRLGEEPAILDKVRRGEGVRNFETVRRRKDGSLVDISLTTSPIRDTHGRIVGASKIARDISELKRTRERQQLLLREMNHRVKNLFALTGSIIGLSARSAKTPHELADSARERVAALARAHALTFAHGDPSPHPTTLQSLIRAIVAPFDEPEAPRIAISGVDVPVSGGAVASLALLLHEFATNAAKYGALSSVNGTIAIDCVEEGDNVVVSWTERGGPPVVQPKGVEGFGGVLSRIAVMSQLGGEITRDWKPEGLEIRLIAPRCRLAG